MKTAYFFAILYCLSCWSTSASPVPRATSDIDDDVGLNITAYLTKYHYPAESHDVQTEDGYILTMHRIPHGRTNIEATDRPVIFLMHGVLMNSMGWVFTGPEKSLAIELADKGYDVWLGNQRGNTYGKRHVKLDPVANASQFWDFSFHEIGNYDVAAYIDYILNVTGKDKISYIGHSQGTAALFALLSCKPEYNNKIELAIAFAPIAYMKHAEHPLIHLASNYSVYIDIAASILNIHEILPHYPQLTEIGKMFCKDGDETQYICTDIVFIFAGFDAPQFNKTLLPMLASSTPDGVSLKQLQHFIQLFQSGYYRQYDYGFIGNLGRYGSTTPPNYNTTNIATPMVFYRADQDLFSSLEDVQRLASEMAITPIQVKIPYEQFTHVDYIFAEDVNDLLYNDVFKRLGV